ncbi:NAD(+) synthase [Eubacteriales bacterium OttesenSCG-928-N14]|nr:NAD(+) synthase [Eubacteriales bacterium OttesenSCG-928-N14]
MMRNYETETQNRIAFIQRVLEDANSSSIVYGNSGGKDSALVGILCKLACPDTVGVIMPISSKQNYGQDTVDALAVAEQYGIATITVDLTPVKQSLVQQISPAQMVNKTADININPRLRMTTLYAVGASRGALVAGTGNRSEAYMGYFTKYGDGGYDFNPIADLTVAEIYEFLRHLDAPKSILTKPPSAGLFDGQTDEQEMGLTYADLDGFLLTGKGDAMLIEKVQATHAKTEHKRNLPIMYQGK